MRIRGERGARAFEDDASAFERDRAVRQRQRLLDVLLDEDQRLALVGDRREATAAGSASARGP